MDDATRDAAMPQVVLDHEVDLAAGAVRLVPDDVCMHPVCVGELRRHVDGCRVVREFKEFASAGIPQ
jgi:hypothetical protein